jgi:hypothetical protein
VFNCVNNVWLFDLLYYYLYIFWFYCLTVCLIHVKWVPCHHGMARHQVTNGGDGLQIWRVATNILNKQSRTADRGWSSSLGVGRGAKTHHRKKSNLLRNISQSLGPGRILWQNDLGTEKWIAGVWSGFNWLRIGIIGGLL